MKSPAAYPNLVFDMGNVLVDYATDLATRQFTDDESVIREVRLVVYYSAEWVKLDGGFISEEEALASWMPRLSSDAAREAARLSFRDWPKYNMHQKPGMAQIIRDVKKRGQKVYVLSNASCRLPEIYRDYLPAAELYDGTFFSAAYQVLKPQKEMYLKFFDVFSLKPEDCFFIDDLPENIKGAAESDMDGYVFSDGNPDTLRKVLGLPGESIHA